MAKSLESLLNLIIFSLKPEKSLRINDADELPEYWNYPYMEKYTAKQVHNLCLVYISFR